MGAAPSNLRPARFGFGKPASGRSRVTPTAFYILCERRFPLRHINVRIGTATVVMLVVLRLSLGCHFLYEGVWKITNPDFSAEPFLTQAKGPAAPLFYMMVPDLDGRQRLRIETDEEGEEVIKGESFLTAWENLKQACVEQYQLGPEQTAEADKLHLVYKKSLEVYLAENREEIAGYFTSLDDLEKRKADGNHGAAHQKKRLWDRQQELRREVRGWLSEIEGLGEEYQMALWNVLDEDQQAQGPIRAAMAQTDVLPVDLPLVSGKKELLDFAVTYGLTAIGLCLVLGFCTRLAAIGGGCFMFSVILTQPSWPTIYPPAPSVVGHALLVNKDWIEMVALFFLATTAVGRWGGLDFFLYHWIVRPFVLRKKPEDIAEG